MSAHDSRPLQYDDRVPAMQYVEEKLLRAFEEGLKETRHALKQDIAALSSQVASNALASTREHADVQGKIANLTAEVAELKPLRQAVAELEEHDAVATATADVRKTLWRAAACLAGLVVAAAGALAAVLS